MTETQKRVAEFVRARGGKATYREVAEANLVRGGLSKVVAALVRAGVLVWGPACGTGATLAVKEP